MVDCATCTLCLLYPCIHSRMHRAVHVRIRYICMFPASVLHFCLTFNNRRSSTAWKGSKRKDPQLTTADQEIVSRCLYFWTLYPPRNFYIYRTKIGILIIELISTNSSFVYVVDNLIIPEWHKLLFVLLLIVLVPADEPELMQEIYRCYRAYIQYSISCVEEWSICFSCSLCTFIYRVLISRETCMTTMDGQPGDGIP